MSVSQVDCEDRLVIRVGTLAVDSGECVCVFVTVSVTLSVSFVTATVCLWSVYPIATEIVSLLCRFSVVSVSLTSPVKIVKRISSVSWVFPFALYPTESFFFSPHTHTMTVPA